MSPNLDPSPTQPSEIAQLLDEHHLVVLADDPRDRDRFSLGLTEQLAALPESQVVHILGSKVEGLATFCRELEQGLGDGQRVPKSVQGIIDMLRGMNGPAKRQYFVWHDAETMLDIDIRLFGRLVNAFLGVAAEREHVSPDILVIQRVVFLGDHKLGAYAEDECGQFSTWLLENGATPFWEVVSCVERPPVLTYRLDG